MVDERLVRYVLSLLDKTWRSEENDFLLGGVSALLQYALLDQHESPETALESEERVVVAPPRVPEARVVCPQCAGPIEVVTTERPGELTEGSVVRCVRCKTVFELLVHIKSGSEKWNT